MESPSGWYARLATVLTTAPLKNDDGETVHFFGAQVDVSSLFHKHNDLSAILSRDFSLADTPPATAEGPRKSFFRRVSEKTKTSLRLNHSLSTTQLSSGLEEEVVRENINTIGEQVDVFRSAYAKVRSSRHTSNLIVYSCIP